MSSLHALWGPATCAFLSYLNPVWISHSVAKEPQHWQQAAETAAQLRVFDALPVALRDNVQIQWQWRGMRGIATQHCKQGWQIGDIKLQQLARIHVPLQCGEERGSVVGSAELVAPVWQTSRDLPAKHVLTANDLQAAHGTLRSLDQLIEHNSLIGLQLRRETPQHTVLEWSQLVRPVVLRKGDTLEIRASHEGVTVHVAAVATRPVRLGEHTVVRNLRSQELVHGKLVAPRLLEADAQRQGGVKVEMESSD